MIVGIDPGLTGAIGVLHDDCTFYGVYDMPLREQRGKNVICGASIARLFLDEDRFVTVDACYVELVSAMPGQGVTSMFNFGKGAGKIEGVLEALGIPYTHVAPQSWKKRAGLIKTEKDAARQLAQRLWPEAPLTRKKDIGRADALLIAGFGEKV